MTDPIGVVLHIVSELRPGGAEIRLLETLRMLPEDERRRHIIATVSGSAGDLAPDFGSLGVAVFPQHMRSLSYPLDFWALLRRTRPTCAICYLNATSGYQMLLAALARTPRRVVSLRSDGVVPASRISKLLRSVKRLLINLFSTTIVGVAPSVVEHQLPSMVSSSRCRVVPNGFVVGQAVRPVAGDLRKQLGVPPSAKLVAHVGRGDLKTKNRDRAVTILAALIRLDPTVHLLFVGRDGRTDEQAERNRAHLKHLATRLGLAEKVHWLGERRDVPSILSESQCTLVTSSVEGLPGVVVESLISATPVVSSDVPGAMYIADHLDGVHCVSLDAPDSMWAMATLYSLQLSRERRERLSQQLAGSVFDMNVSIHQMRAIWYG